MVSEAELLRLVASTPCSVQAVCSVIGFIELLEVIELNTNPSNRPTGEPANRKTDNIGEAAGFPPTTCLALFHNLYVSSTNSSVSTLSNNLPTCLIYSDTTLGCTDSDVSRSAHSNCNIISRRTVVCSSFPINKAKRN